MPSHMGLFAAGLEDAFVFYRSQNERYQPAAGFDLVSFKGDSLELVDSASWIIPTLQNRKIFADAGFASFEDRLYMMPAFEDVIYAMDAEGQLDTAFVLNMPTSLRFSGLSELSDPVLSFFDLLDAWSESERIHFHGSLSITSSHLIFTSRKGDGQILTLYDLRSGASRYFDSRLLNPHPQVDVRLVGADQEFFYMAATGPTEILESLTGQKIDLEKVSAVVYKVRFKDL